ncbi:dna polymerase subunit alpha [Plasmopara halstedii]|uniref:DNA polymerase alpha subunit B n=1 Tax=Plasmopara halstedii TaxID=4781 RepID=A0A0P1A3Q1_PLAHL|nr:dna polymerase subunit alpha [Plasmopara halstedii]CEG35078.1 dna polymerase subunit alpha [Plasmopara halstedii]|eukprot:XP_024571447.1 dna polymerase subunit alpha [Plasmopara halstedii]
MSLDVSAVRAAFAACNLDLEDDAASTCVSICAEFNMSCDDMAAQWDAYSMNQQLSGAADTENLVAFRSHLKQLQQNISHELTPNVSAPKRRHTKTPVVKRESNSQDKLESLYSIKSPEGKHARSFTSPTGISKVQRKEGVFSPSSMQSPPGSSYEKRIDAGKTVYEFNEHLKKKIEGLKANLGKPVEVMVPYPSRNLLPNAPYMYTPLFRRAIALDEQLVEYEMEVKKKVDLEELKPVGDPSPAQVTVVGRIVCEAAEGKLNPSVVQIEGSRKTCGGQRVLLDLNGVSNFQIFPGKIVALEGVLSDVRSPMVVKRFLEPILAPAATSLPARIKKLQIEHEEPIRVLTACGPFTTTSNVDYLPLNDLLQVVMDQKPDVLILLGPFIDTNHSMFQDGLVKYDDMMLSFEEIFLFKVMTLLNNVLKHDEQIQIIIVPSLRDANHEYMYPQPPLSKSKACEAFEVAEHAKRVHFMSNPTTFSINAIVFGISTLDIIVQLSSNELYRRAQGRDHHRLLRLCEQVVEQRSFYPIFPPPPSGEAPVDLRYMKQFQFEQTPDILLLPSILNRFCGRVYDSVAINPGQLCKGDSGGSFAHITILPLPNEKIESAGNDMCAHSVPDRTIVEIKRI